MGQGVGPEDGALAFAVSGIPAIPNPEKRPAGPRDANIRTAQELLGHKSVKTTMIYTHVLNKGGKGVRSPVDGL